MSSGRKNEVWLIIFVLLLAMIRVAFSVNPIEEAIAPIVEPIYESLESVAFSLDPVEYDADFVGEAIKEDESSSQSALPMSIAARVIRKDILSIRKYFYVADVDANIKVGDEVLYKGFLIGQVIGTDGSITVQLISDPDFRVTARAETKGSNGIVKTTNGSLIFDLSSKRRLEGQLIRSDGVDGSFASGLAIGTLRSNVSGENDIFQGYDLILPFNPSNIDDVDIVPSGSLIERDN